MARNTSIVTITSLELNLLRMKHESPLLPITDSPRSPQSTSSNGIVGPITLSARRLFRRPLRVVVLVGIALVVVIVNWVSLNVLRRDLGYLLRPLWDSPEAPFTIIPHFPWPGPVRAVEEKLVPDEHGDWCRLHNWSPRKFRPAVIDAVPVATELDMLEIRMREYAPYVSLFIIVEANMTHAGTPKPLHFAEDRKRFEAIAHASGSRIAYTAVLDFEAHLPKGSFANEVKQRRAIGEIIGSERQAGSIPSGSIIIQSDVDEIISRETLDLLTSCHGYPDQLHLNVKNYRYSFNQPLRDEGYWRPRAVTVRDSMTVGYNHARAGNVMLAGAGWHCSFCFRTLDDMRAKMMGCVHNDRMTRKCLLEEKSLRKRVCEGRDPFNMWPVSIACNWTDDQEAFTFRDLVALSGSVLPSNDFTHLPVALKESPESFGYLLDQGCDRPDR